LLQARDISVRYGSIVAVRDASIEVRAGELAALVGPNGAGKTSLLSALAGVVAAEGDVILNDVSLHRLPPERRAAAGLSFVPDGRRVFGRLSVEQNLAVGSIPLPRRESARAVAAVRDRFPLLAARARQRADTLSGGEAQLLMIARALVSRPSAVLIDEPLQGLSEEAAALVLDALRSVAADGAAVLIASPDPIEGVNELAMYHGAIGEVAR
jgi:branched-chain amino acid transport system ATP-binding protein